MQNKSIVSLDKGMVIIDNKTKQPNGTYSYALNATPGNSIIDRSTLANERGFDDSIILKDIDYTIIGSEWLGPNEYVFFIKNKELDTNTFNEIWVSDNGVNRLVINNDNLSFSDSGPITTTYRTNSRGERLVYFVDGINDDRVINIDNDYSALPITDSISFLSIIPNAKSPEISVDVNNDGGNMKSGQYFVAAGYTDENSYETSALYFTTEISISPNGNYVSSGGSSTDNEWALVNGASLAESRSTKSITINISDIDTSYKFLNIYVVRVVDTLTEIYKIDNIYINNNASATYTFSGSDNYLDSSLDLNELIVRNINYYASHLVNQKENRLIRGNSKIKSDNINYQEIANEIKVTYRREAQTIANNEAYKTFNELDINHNLTSTYDIETYATDPLYLSKIDSVDVSSRTFMRDEVYSLGISFDLNDGTETGVFHIPGRLPNAMSSSGLDGVGEEGRLYNSSSQSSWDTSTVEGPEGMWRYRNTAVSRTSGDGDLGYWRSDEVYPDGYGYPTDGEKDSSGRSYVRHHRMPSDLIEPLRRTNVTNRNTTPFSYEYNIEKYNILLNFSNIVIPDRYLGVITRAKIHYTKRDYNNKSIISKGLIMNTLKQGNIYRAPYSFNNFAGILTTSSVKQFLSPDVDFNHGEFPIRGDYFKPLSVDKGYILYNYVRAFVVNPLEGLNGVYNFINLTRGDKSAVLDNTLFLSGNAFYNESTTPIGLPYRTDIENGYFTSSNSTDNLIDFTGEQKSSVLDLANNMLLVPIYYASIFGYENPASSNNYFDKFNYNGQISTLNVADHILDETYYDTVIYGSIVRDNRRQYGDVLSLDYIYSGRSLYIASTSKIISVNSVTGDSYIDVHYTKKSFKSLNTNENNLGVGYAADSSEESGLIITRQTSEGINIVDENISNSYIAYLVETDINIRMRNVGESPSPSTGSYFPIFAINNKEISAYEDRSEIEAEYNLFPFYNTKNITTQNASNITLEDFSNNRDFRYDTRLIYSDQQNIESNIDSYRITRANNYVDLPANRGPLTQSLVKQEKFYALTRDALFDVYASNKFLSTIDGDSMAVGTGEFFGLEPAELISIKGGFGGTSSKFSLSESPYGYLFVDKNKNKVTLFNETLKDINAVGLEEDFSLNILDKYKDMSIDGVFDSPSSGVGILTKYDPMNHRFLITKKDYKLIDETGVITVENGHLYRDGTYLDFNDKDIFEDRSFTVSYDPINDTWISYHSYTPEFYIDDIKGFRIKDSSNIIKMSNSDNYSEDMPFIMEVVFNDNPFITKVNDSLSVNVISEDINGAFVNDFFNSVVMYNSNQSSGELVLDSDTLTKKEQNWNIHKLLDYSKDEANKELFTNIWNDIKDQYPIDKVVNGQVIDYNKEWHRVARFRDKYFVVRFKYDNLNNNKLLCNFVTSSYRVSNR